MRPQLLSTPVFSALAALALALVGSACDPGLETGEGSAELAQHPDFAALPGIERATFGADGQVAFVAGDLGLETEAVAAAFDIDPAGLELADARRDSLGFTHQRFTQTRGGLPVIGGDFRLSIDDGGVIRAATGVAWGDTAPATTASVPAADAARLAADGTAGASSSSAAELVYVAPSSGGVPVLAWRSLVTGERADGLPIADYVFVDAVTGTIVDRHPLVHDARNRVTYDAANQEALGTVARSEGEGPTGDIDIDTAHDAAGLAYDCFNNLFARDSYDNLGSTLQSIAHFGQDFRNAAWDGQNRVMIYGDGFAVFDIGTHELAHAVTQYTGNMVYANEPGGLNEAWSDIMSAVCDVYETGTITTATWSIGEDLNVGGLVGPFRFMDDPTRDNYSPDHYSNVLQLPAGTEPSQENDFGGVHGNSGIANLAFVLLVEGGTHPRDMSDVQVVGVGMDDAGQIFYRALANYMGQTTDFAGARAATEQAAGDLFGAGSSEQISVSEAWAAVGVGGPAPARQDPDGDNDPDDPTDPNDPDQAPGGNVTGGCSVGASSGSASLLWLLGLMAVFPLARRRRR